jgi:hypothetical protein
MSLEFFEKQGFSPTNIVTKTANYTALITDDQINATGSGVAITLPSLLSLQGTMNQRKMYYIVNNGATYDLTITPGTNSDTNVANTIGGKASWTLKPNESILITGLGNLLDWGISSPRTLPVLGRNYFAIVASTSSTATVNIFDANGAPTNLQITEILVNALDATASSVTVTNGASTMCTINKGTTANVIVPAGTISYPSVASGATFTIAASATNGSSRVTIIGTAQTLVQFSN